MKPSDSKERVRERVQRHRAGVTPHVTPPQDVTPRQDVPPPVTPLVFTEDEGKQRMSQPHVTPSVPPLQELEEWGVTSAIPQRTAGKTPEESGYPEGQVEVSKGPQGQVLWRLRGYYDLPNKILCDKA